MPIVFYSKTPEYAWLSNFSRHGFELDGARWRSVEHYYQAQKYAGTEMEERIRNAPNAPAARDLGQNRSLTVRPDWPEAKEAVMRRALEAKFTQHRRLREQLLTTGEEPLLHHSSSDSYWGCGKEGDGQNRLGVILMEIRQALRSLKP